MLQKLIINNYAIIDSLVVSFGSGLNILTGETGAGKSIIIGAIGLLLGERVSGDILRHGTSKGFVEGHFLDPVSNDHNHSLNQPTQNQLTQMTKSGSDSKQGAGANSRSNSNGVTILRREMTATGGSKYLINGEPTTIQNARSIFSGIIDVHGQNQHQSLLFPDNYLAIVDRFGHNSELAELVKEKFSEISKIISEKRALQNKIDDISKKRDFLEFQLKEIDELNPQADELEELETESKLLNNSEKIVNAATDCCNNLNDDQKSASVGIRAALDALSELKEILPEHEQLHTELETALINVEETASILQKYTRSVDFDPYRLEEINERVSDLRRLLKKYSTDIEGIIAKRDDIKKMLSGEEDYEYLLKQFDKKIETAQKEYNNLAEELSEKRKKTAVKLVLEIKSRLDKLGMEKSVFQISVEKKEKGYTDEKGLEVKLGNSVFIGNENGLDKIDMLIATGKSERINPVSQIASGGELSRIMLAIKSALSAADEIPVLVFDEVDSGISGRIASAVGRELKVLSKYHQLLCITHLPQIACMSDAHYSVEKIEKDGRIITTLKKLSEDGKINEVAKLLAGDKVTDIHIKNAKELINETS